MALGVWLIVGGCSVWVVTGLAWRKWRRDVAQLADDPSEWCGWCMQSVTPEQRAEIEDALRGVEENFFEEHRGQDSSSE